MKKSYCIVISWVLLSVFACQPDSQIQRAKWIVGTWIHENPPRTIYESWSWNGDQELLAMSYRLEGKDTILLEQVQLVQTNDSLYFRPTVEGQNEGATITFSLKSISDQGWEFENPEHDFPQLIAYKRIGKDSLVATVSGIVEGELRERHFGMRRRLEE